MNLHTWAQKWGVPLECLRDLQTTLGIYTPPLQADDPGAGKSEGWAQSAVLLEASQKDVRLFRNNSGALKDKTGRLVRFGLGNTSEEFNRVFKSPDLLGWRRVTITPQHVGHIIAQTVMREMKKPGWQYTGDEHEAAQLACLNMCSADGGDACFATGPGTL